MQQVEGWRDGVLLPSLTEVTLNGCGFVKFCYVLLGPTSLMALKPSHGSVGSGLESLRGTNRITVFQVVAASDEFQRPLARVSRSQTTCDPRRRTQFHSRPDAGALRLAP